MTVEFVLRQIGVVRSSLTDRKGAPRQGYEGAPEASVDVDAEFMRGLDGIKAGDEIVLLTWLHQGQRDVLEVRRSDGAPPVVRMVSADSVPSTQSSRSRIRSLRSIRIRVSACGSTRLFRASTSRTIV